MTNIRYTNRRRPVPMRSCSSSAALTSETLLRFQNLAIRLGLDAIVEVHDLAELETAISIDAKIIGVNNRNLKTFEVSLDVSRELIKHAPKDVAMITESGLKTRDDLIELHDLGYSGFLIGETLMRSGDPETELRKLTNDDQELRSAELQILKTQSTLWTAGRTNLGSISIQEASDMCRRQDAREIIDQLPITVRKCRGLCQ